jgi:hypothetical protein
MTLLLGLALVACRNAQGSGCKSDADCKGSRVCIDNTCQDPAGSAPQATPPPAAQTAGNRLETTAAVSPPAQNERGIVRVSPAFNAAKVTELLRGTVVTIVESSSDGLWRRVRWSEGGGGEGWMHQDVLSEGGPPRPKAANPVPGGSCTDNDTNPLSCTCAGGRRGTMVCLGRSLTWSACSCG